MSNLTDKIVDWSEAVSEALTDLETVPAGESMPPYRVSEHVSVSKDRGLYVYHVAGERIGQGPSLGNTHVWAETKGNGHMLGLFGIQTNTRMLGGTSLTYQVPFSELSAIGHTADDMPELPHNHFAHILPMSQGQVHLHPAYQQREFVLSEGLRILETFYVPRTGGEDPAAACKSVMLWNRMPHPIQVTVVATVDLRGHTPRDLQAVYDADEVALLAHNASHPDWVRFFSADPAPDHYWATSQLEGAYNPHEDLPDEVSDSGDIVGALQFDVLLLPKQWRKVRLITGFSTHGRDEAKRSLRAVREDSQILTRTVAHYRDTLGHAEIEMPDDLLSEGVQWAKTCMLRPLSRYRDRWAFTNDPGHSSHLVGRDLAWYTHGSDYIWPDTSCDMLALLTEHQREDGAISEHIDGLTGHSETHEMNINDNTPLFILAAAHHLEITGHQHCFDRLYQALRRAADLILSQRDARGLVYCTAEGEGVRGICGWRNAWGRGQINGAVTEVNAECYAALHAAGRIARRAGDQQQAEHYCEQAETLRANINTHLIDSRTGLYVRNIDTAGRVFSQATADLVFPLMFGVADGARSAAIRARLLATDFMSSGGVRALPQENPQYDPSENAGLLGGVWPGVTWWFAMGCSEAEATFTAQALRRSYAYLVRDPLMFDTVPGQFNEWSDGETLVNRGMRLSPWAPPRFLWALIEGVVGVQVEDGQVHVNPRLPHDWLWLRVHRLPIREQVHSFVFVRGEGEHKIISAAPIKSRLPVEQYDRQSEEIEAMAVGVSATAFLRGEETLVFVGNSRDHLLTAPLLLHRLLDVGTTYRVNRFDSIEGHWQQMGRIDGSDLQRVAVRLEPRGYGLYHFEAQR